MPDLVLKDVYYRYPRTKKDVLKGVSAVFSAGSLITIQGQSGSGKSTLLYLISGLDSPSAGDVCFNGVILSAANLQDFRRNHVATISQNYLLFPARTVIENVMYPLELSAVPKQKAFHEAQELLLSVGISESLFNRLPNKLSGGEQQRVAIARALAAHSQIIAADEPTGNLDEDNMQAVMNLLKNLAHNKGKTVIIVTHDKSVAEMADFMYALEYGKLIRLSEQKG